MALPKMDTEAVRLQLNLSNLKRHDPHITAIVSSTSYASVYENRGEGWVKTGVEGPMFLFSRTTSPSYGFFVLNRQGLEYVQEFLTEESEVKVEGEFILYEGGQDVDRATGIWVFEEKERVEVCQQMEALRQKAVAKAKPATRAPSFPIGQSISLDALFASASPASSPAVTPATAPSSIRLPAGNPLDALFASASAANSPVSTVRSPISPVPAYANVPGGIPNGLAQLFASASPTPQTARLPQQQTPASPSQAAEQPTGMALLNSIFASAAQVPSPVVQAARQPSTSSPYQTPQPQAASLPPAHSPLPMSGSQTLPPAPSSQQPDARAALLSMLGVSSPLPSPSATTASQPEPQLVNAAINGDLASSSSLPHAPPATTEHPVPFSMGGGAEIAQLDQQQPNGGEQKKAKEEKKVAKPFFAPPVLSHDIFDLLPKVKSAPKDKGKAKATVGAPTPASTASIPSPVEEISFAAVERAPSPPAPSPPAPAAPVPAAPTSPQLPFPASIASPAIPSSVASPVVPSSSASPVQPLHLSKSELLSTIDSAAASSALVNGSAGGEPMEKDEFVKRIVEMVQKPSFAMQLYGRYLERFEEHDE